MVPAIALIDGSLSPGVRLRAAIRCRTATMTAETRVPSGLELVTASLICTGVRFITVRENCTVLCLAVPDAALDKSAATNQRERWMDRTASGWINGLLGVLIFSGSLPATRVAVMQFDPVFLTVARAAIAGLLGLCLLLALQGEATGPRRRHSPDDCRYGRCCRLPAAHGPGAAARYLGAFHRLHRAAAAGDRDLRCAARRRATARGVLVVLRARQRACRGLRDQLRASQPLRSAML